MGVTCLLLFAPAAALFVQGAGCSCNGAMFYSGTTTSLLVPGGAASLEGATVEACVNETCRTASLTRFNDGSLGCDEGSEELPSLGCFGQTSAGGLSLEITLSIDDDKAESGDFYTFVVTAPGDAATVLAEREGAVEYEESEPNGRFCGTVYTATL